MSLDLFALSITATTCASVFLLLMIFGRPEACSTANWCVSAYLFGEAAVAIPTLAGGAVDGSIFVALNAVGFLACASVWRLSRLFYGRQSRLPGLTFGIVAWITAVVALRPESSAFQWRIGAALLAIYAVQTVYEAWSESRRKRQERVHATDRSRLNIILEAIEDSLRAAEQAQAGLSLRVEDLLARAAVTMGNDTDEYLQRDPLDRHHQHLFDVQIADSQRRLRELEIEVAHLRSLRDATLNRP